MKMTTDLAKRLGPTMPKGAVTMQKLVQAKVQGYACRAAASMLDFMRKART